MTNLDYVVRGVASTEAAAELDDLLGGLASLYAQFPQFADVACECDECDTDVLGVTAATLRAVLAPYRKLIS